MEESKDPNPIVVFFTNLFAAIKLPFPPKKTNVADNGAEVESAIVKSTDEANSKALVVTFPEQTVPPLKLEQEPEEAERSTNPVLLWQVYALGGILILRWAWKRWNENGGRKKPDEPPPSQD